MKRLKTLTSYQKGFLILLTAMVLAFTVVYPLTIARVGFAYQDAILIPTQENDNVVYSGKIQGKLARFTVFEDNTVEFQYGENTYGPYTAKEEPTAIPKDHEMYEYMTGVELRQGPNVIFRGAILSHGEDRLLFNEDGSLNISAADITNNWILNGANGNSLDSLVPPASTILELMAGPQLTHKGDWMAWFGGILICVITAISILFADELFRWNLSFQIRNVDKAEPSDLEIVCRYIGWAALSFLAMMLFIKGLQ